VPGLHSLQAATEERTVVKHDSYVFTERDNKDAA
jgi:hypothetical protein